MKKLFTLACVFSILSGIHAQWLGNDDCANAFPLTVGAPCTAGDNTIATIGTDFSMSCGTTDAAVWFSFVCPLSGSVTISTDHAGTSFDTHINLLGAAAGDPTLCPGAGFMFEYGCDDDGGGTIAPFSSTLTVAGLVPGQTYWIQVDGFSGATGTYCIDIIETVCTADAGTFTVNVTGGSTIVVGDTIWVCDNAVSCFEIISNNDFVLPPPQTGETSELMFALFNCPPSTADPATDPCYTGLLWTGQDFSDCNPSSFGLTGTIFFVPITADDSDNPPDPNGVIHWDQNGDGCFDMGPAFSVQYLNEVVFSAVENFCLGEVDIAVSGGSPEVSGDDYTIVNTGTGTLVGTPISHGGSITISGLVDGDAYSISVTDPLGCVTVFGGTFSGDNIAPTITCPSDITANNDPGSCDAAITVPIPVTSDNCVVASLVNDFNGTGNASGTYPIGITTVNWTVTDAVGLTTTCSMTVTISDNENPTPICQDIVVNLDVAGNVIIANTDIDAGSSDNCAISALSLDITSFTCTDIGVNVVTLSVEDAVGNNVTCASNVTVVDPNVPTASAGSNGSVCEGNSFTLSGMSGGSATTGSWGSSSDGSFSSGGTDPVGTYTPGPLAIAAGSVDLTWTTALSPCISANATMTLTIVSAPTYTVTLTTDPTSCGGVNGVITISGLDLSTNYDISYDDDGVQVDSLGVTTDASGNLVISGLDAGNYDNWNVDLSGCTGTDATVIALTDPSAPTYVVTFTSDPTSCGGNDGSITISGLDLSTTYDISYDDDGVQVDSLGVTTDAAGNLVINGLDAGSYNSWSVDLSGCTGTDVTVITLTEPAAPTITVTLVLNPSTCGGADGSITISGLSPSTVYDLHYDADGTQIDSLGMLSDASGNIVISGLDAGFYDNWNLWSVATPLCISMDNTSIGLTDPSTPTYVVTFTSDPSSCGIADGSITISGLDLSTTYDISYDDDGVQVDSLGVTTDASGNLVIGGLDAGNYDNWSVDLFGCTGTDATVITLTDPLAPLFTVALTLDPSSCGGSDGSITISGLVAGSTYDVGYDDDGTPVASAGLLADPSGEIVISGLDAGNYDNWSVDLFGCTGTDAALITLTDPPTPIAPVSGDDSSYCEGDLLASLTAISGFGGTLNWYNESSLTVVLGSGPSFVPAATLGTTIYYVNETSNGCVGPASSVMIDVSNCPIAELIPNIFTPNGDGVNDVLVFSRTGVDEQQGFIYNRWGEMIFSWSQEVAAWDGRNNAGEICPAGTYYYVFTVVTFSGEQIIYNGSVTLER